MSIYEGPAVGLGGGTQDVAVPGTPEALVSTSTPCAWVIVTAAPGNTGNVTVGDANVDATTEAERGVTLDALQSVTIPINDVSKVYVDCDGTAGDGVGFVYGKVSEDD